MLSSLRAVTSLNWENLSGEDRWERGAFETLVWQPHYKTSYRCLR